MHISDKNSAIIGGFFGDEAKARIANWMAKNFRYVVRFSGSSNAGHTFYYNGQKIVRHLLPSVDFSIKEHFAFLGSGMAINPEELIKEIKENEAIFPNIADKIIVDPDAFVITKEHLEEDKINVKTLGSTGKGVSPCYRDRINRKGIRILDLIKDNNENILYLQQMGVQFKHSLELYDDFIKSPILFEGAQSALLDINFGTYPCVTSGDCGVGGIFNAGFAFAMPKEIYGIVKAYATRVGHGPFPTELFGEEAERLRALGLEYGATTGKPRRIGWLDLVALNYVCKKAGLTKLIISKFDILNGMKKVPVCNSYNKQVFCGEDFFDVKPNYINLPGWNDASNVEELKPFIKYIVDYVGLPIKYVSFGTGNEHIAKI